jgi:uncharacterized membrane protein
MIILVLGLALFLGVHSLRIVAPHIRGRVIASRGEGAWKLPYTAVSVVGLLLIIIGYAMARYDAPQVYVPPTGLRHLALLVMLPVFPLLIATYAKGRIGQLVGHPMLLATALWGAAHLMANGTLADVLLFGGFLIWALFDWRSARVREDGSSRVGAAWGINDAVAVAAGLAIYGALIGGLHALLFGVSPI